jgi:predicted RNA binding protein YcfA (HicA-like mRNA interferase family)
LLDFDLRQSGFVEKARKGAHDVLVHHRAGFLFVVGCHQLNSVSL